LPRIAPALALCSISAAGARRVVSRPDASQIP
jgi:hypothetical protein